MSTLNNSVKLIKFLKLDCRGRKNKNNSVIFIDFCKAFDNVDREILFRIIGKRLNNEKLAMTLLSRLLHPSRIYLNDSTYFKCMNGTPLRCICVRFILCHLSGWPILKIWSNQPGILNNGLCGWCGDNGRNEDITVQSS